MMKRALSIFLTCVFLLGMLPTSALAAEADSGGLCPHHQEHSFEDCGYMEAMEGQPCGHVHDGDCGYVEAAEEIPCDMDCNETGEDSQIIHAEGCGYVPEVAPSRPRRTSPPTAAPGRRPSLPPLARRGRNCPIRMPCSLIPPALKRRRTRWRRWTGRLEMNCLRPWRVW